MEDSLGYSAGEAKHVPNSWKVSHDKYMIDHDRASKEFLQYKSYHLHLKRKREQVTGRRNFPTTYAQRLTFLRAYVSSINKIQIMVFYSSDFNTRVWTLVIGLIIINMGHSLVHIFLASYVPETHSYLAKMVPFMRGITYFSIFAGSLEYLAYVMSNVNVLDFLFLSIFYKSPWNDCPKNGYFETEFGNLHCYSLTNVGKVINNKTVRFFENYYIIEEDNSKFQIGQMHFFTNRLNSVPFLLVCMYTAVNWVIMFLSYEKIFKKSLWRALNTAHYIVIALFLTTSVYFTLILDSSIEIPKIPNTPGRVTKLIPEMDFNYFRQVLVAPPVMHILLARTSDEVKPLRESTALTTSNALYDLLRTYHYYIAKCYMEQVSKLRIYIPNSRHMSATIMFYCLLFSTHPFGDAIGVMVFSVIFVIETIISIIHLEMLLEVITSEWKRISRYRVGLFIYTSTMFIHLFRFFIYTNYMITAFYCKAFLAIFEMIIIYIMYPIFRLVDDMSFHFGRPVHPCRKYLMVFFPVVVIFFSWNMWRASLNSFDTYWGLRLKRALILLIPVVIITIIGGMGYTYYKLVVKQRRNWRRMFAPTEDWGPSDYVVRQLRKDYDSRTYTNSEVSRNLSRHIYAKSEAKAYDLDICYDHNRRSTQIGYELKGIEIPK